MFPMIGSFNGPGGKFGVDELDFLVTSILCAMNRKLIREKIDVKDRI